MNHYKYESRSWTRLTTINKVNGRVVRTLSSYGIEVSSILTLLQNNNNMSKIKDNYLAEILIVLVITTMLLTSCASTSNCPAYATIECENCDEID